MPWVNRHSHPRLPGLRLGAESMEPSSCLAKARKCEESMMGGTEHMVRVAFLIPSCPSPTGIVGTGP